MPETRALATPLRIRARGCAALLLLAACASQRPLPARTTPSATHTYRERAPASASQLGSVLVDAVDGPALIKRDTPSPPWPSLCATPCLLTLPRGEQKLGLWFTDESGRVSVDHLTIQVRDEPTVHRRAMTRYKVTHRGLSNTAIVVGMIGLTIFSFGLGSLPWASDKDELATSGIIMASGGVLVGTSAIFSAFGGKRLRGSELVFPLAPAR